MPTLDRSGAPRSPRPHASHSMRWSRLSPGVQICGHCAAVNDGMTPTSITMISMPCSGRMKPAMDPEIEAAMMRNRAARFLNQTDADLRSILARYELKIPTAEDLNEWARRSPMGSTSPNTGKPE